MSNIPFIIPSTGPLAGLIRFAGVPGVKVYNGNNLNFNIPQGPTRDTPLGISPLGTAVYSDLTLMGVTYSDTSQPQNSLGQYPKITLPDDRTRIGGQTSTLTGPGSNSGFYMNIQDVIIKLSQKVNVVTTKIQGAPPGFGEVDEYIGTDSARLTIAGRLTAANGVSPEDDTYRLKQWLDAPVAKGIICKWLDNLRVSSLIVLGYDLPQMEGEYSTQYFKIEAKASMPVQLKITTPISNVII